MPKDSEEYKKWKALKDSGALDGQLGDLSLKPNEAAEAPKMLPGGKVKKKSKPEIVLERNTRNKKKCVTTVTGLDLFGIKLAEASKLFGKKFASGASITKNAMEKEQIDVQGDFIDKMPDVIFKQYKDKGVAKKDIYILEDKKKVRYYPDE